MAGKARKLGRRGRRRATLRKRAVPRRGGRGDASALRGIKQGVGRSVATAFGYGRGPVNRYHPCHHDAFHHAHLPLPRAVGPYTVVRTTQLLKTNKPFVLFGPCYNTGAAKWTDIAALSFNNLSQNVGTAGNVNVVPFSSIRGNASWTGAQIAPAAYSVQIMNPNALQTTAGIVYIGRIRTALRLSSDLSDAITALANQLVSYNNPRLCSAAKLAFRGVQIDLVPFNMNRLSDFTLPSADSFTQYGASSPDPSGFAPAFIYNPDNLDLQYLMCAEWRVRFDPSNPAQATHEVHHPAPESIWAQAQHTAEAIGNGVVDIADRVANVGNAVYGAARGAYGAMRGMQALRGAAQLALV